MGADHYFLSTYLKGLSTLMDSSGKFPENIPESYLAHFYHEYSDGAVSMLPLISRMQGTEFLDAAELEEVVESLSKVDPLEWPDIDSIHSLDAISFLGDQTTESFDFLEDNLGAAEKVEQVLSKVIEDSFGARVSRIRSKKGKFPSSENNFLQEEDGTFSGTFEYEGHLFIFEIAPTSKGWLTTYRMSEGSLSTLEKEGVKRVGNNKVKSLDKKVRSQGWR